MMDRRAMNRIADCPIAVIGDLMLDCYLHGEVQRISPEAPVPVVQGREERRFPGGAANVVANLATLGAPVHVVGVVGDDETGGALAASLDCFGRVSRTGIVLDPTRPTTRKLRIVGAHQQVVRIDFESDDQIGGRVEAAVMAAVEQAISASRIVVISDYGKGVLTDRVLTHAFATARRQGKLVLVDPKRRDWTAYRGASIITPNRRELAAATGVECNNDEQAVEAAREAQRRCGANVLLTKSERGMTYYDQDGTVVEATAVARDVFDVSGAGDTVIAVLAAALAADVDLADAIKTANVAAGIVVGKFGTATLSADELLAAVVSVNRQTFRDGQLLSLEDAVDLRKEWGLRSLKVGVANGCFDLLHPGHVALIQEAAGACDRLIVALNSDASVRRLKGPRRPVQDEKARAAVIGAIRGVSAVVVFDEDTPLELVQALQPDILVKGADYKEDDVVGGALVKARGGRVVLAAHVPGRSTSSIIEAAMRRVGHDAVAAES